MEEVSFWGFDWLAVSGPGPVGVGAVGG